MCVQVHRLALEEARSRCLLSFKFSAVCGVSLCTWVCVHFCMCVSTCVHNADVWQYFYNISYPNSEFGNIARLSNGLHLGILCCRILKLQVGHSCHLHLCGFHVQRTCLWETDASPTVLVCFGIFLFIYFGVFLFFVCLGDILICLFCGILVVCFGVLLFLFWGSFFFFFTKPGAHWFS